MSGKIFGGGAPEEVDAELFGVSTAKGLRQSTLESGTLELPLTGACRRADNR